MNRKKVYHYQKKSDGNLFPLAVYESITEAAEKAKFGRTTLTYHLNRYGSCSFNLPDSEEVHVLSLRSMIVPDTIEPVIPHLDTDEDYELAVVRYNPVKVKEDNWLTKLKRWFLLD